MGFTNRTKNLGLPQWIDTDEPTWLVDMNNAFEKIDENAGSNQENTENINTEIQAIQQVNQTQGDQLSKLTENNASNTTAISQLQAQQTVNTAHIADLENKTQTMDTDITDLHTQVTENQTANTQALDTLSADLATAKNEISQNTADVTQLRQSVETNTQNIQTNTTNIGNQATEIAGVKAQVTTLDEDVKSLSDLVPTGPRQVESGIIDTTTTSTANAGQIKLRITNSIKKNALYFVKFQYAVSDTTNGYGGIGIPNGFTDALMIWNQPRYGVKSAILYFEGIMLPKASIISVNIIDTQGNGYAGTVNNLEFTPLACLL